MKSKFITIVGILCSVFATNSFAGKFYELAPLIVKVSDENGDRINSAEVKIEAAMYQTLKDFHQFQNDPKSTAIKLIEHAEKGARTDFSGYALVQAPSSGAVKGEGAIRSLVGKLIVTKKGYKRTIVDLTGRRQKEDILGEGFRVRPIEIVLILEPESNKADKAVPKAKRGTDPHQENS